MKDSWEERAWGPRRLQEEFGVYSEGYGELLEDFSRGDWCWSPGRADGVQTRLAARARGRIGAM